MPYLAAATVLVGAIAVLNLLLTTAVIRRMRDDAARGHQPGGGRVPGFGGLPVGAALPAFRGTDATGLPLTDDHLRGGPALVAFLSTDCPSCRQRAGEFAARAAEIAGAGGRSVAVIVQGDESRDPLEAALHAAAEVEGIGAAGGASPDGIVMTVESFDRRGPLLDAFDVTTFPTFFVLGADGRVAERELSEEMRRMMELPPVRASH
jgi:cytochrome oxidase Cu insertion factor (SCO1/SenC/PrrC family)